MAADRLWELTHVPLNDEQRERQRRQLDAKQGYWLEGGNGHHPTAEEVNAWSMSGMGHDSLNQHICIQARCQREGVPDTCPACNGNGTVWFPEDAEAKAEAWEAKDPPVGDGWQLWSTTGDGCPVSPVFATAELLADWCTEHATLFADMTATREEWLAMFVGGSVEAGSMMVFTKGDDE